MKKTLILAAFTAALALISCEKKPEPQPGDNTKTLSASVLSADKASVVLTEATADAQALKLSWTSGLSEGDTEPVTYTLYANKAGKDLFTDPVSIQAGKALSRVFKGGELNDIATQLGLTEQGDIKFGVYAVADKGTYESVLSNLVTVKVTPYKAALVAPSAIFLVGDATPYGWDLSTALSLPNDGHNVYKATAVPLTVEPVSINAGFKFYFSRGQNENDDPRFLGQDPAADAFGTGIIIEDGKGDYKFLPAPAGYTNGLYDITVNLDELTVRIVRKGDLPEEPLPDKLYMLGSCFTWQWNWTGTTLDRVSGNKFEAKNVKMSFNTPENPLGFKVFLAVNKWSPYFAMADDATASNIKIQKVTTTDVPQFYPGKLRFADGTYDIAMDFDAMVATFTLVSSGGQTELPDKLYLHGGCFNPSWTFSDDLVLNKVSDNIYKATNIAFVKDDDWEGFKVYPEKEGWSNWYGMDQTSTKDNIVIVYGPTYLDENPDVADAQFYPVRLGYAKGTYDIEMNFNTMKMTLTAK